MRPFGRPSSEGVPRAPGVFELTWDGNGRATWSYGPEMVPREQHLIWRRIGTHDILTVPCHPIQAVDSEPSRAG
ncbi:hypothetical protein CP976_42260 [Streptomyces coeruleorubidus]|uniref:Uncharacterized protein n=1 Tax=Streptomyces coeruleorubidus TaxID=116188 RepID=A0A5J6IG54_STRC4|nr:hypothetical protein CP976_42260 [Streptomyces coeruleorubidus]